MIVKEIELTSYRSYNKFKINLSPGINIIIGENGIGKTNILESLVVISNTKSFRVLDDFELVKHGCEYSKIEVKILNHSLKIIINNKGKILYIDNNLIRNTSDFIGKLNVILFKPSDIVLFDESPKIRRKLFDIELTKISKNYLNSILNYSKLLKDKNNLLKNDNINHILLETINEQMIPYISNIVFFRNEVVEYINKTISKHYYQIANKHNYIKIVYEKCCLDDKDSIKQMLIKSEEKDMIYRYSSVGPQKDDYTFYFDDKEISSYASQGQKRMVMMAFKLALIDYIIMKTNNKPILLLDDVLSELDLNNKQRLLEVIPNDIQTIITATDLDGIKLKNECKVFKLRREEIHE